MLNIMTNGSRTKRMGLRGAALRLSALILITSLTGTGSGLAGTESALADSGSALAESDLPKAETVLDAYVEATGGLEAYDRITNRVSRGTLEFVAQGIKLDLTVYSARPNQIYVLAASDAMGKMESGVADGVAWSDSTMQGPQIKEGQESVDALRDATFDRLARWPENFSKVETIGMEEVDGRPAYRVLMTPTQGGEQTFWFDRDSHLLVKIESTIESPMGSVPVEAFLSDYRDVDGLRLAHRVRVNALGQERIITTRSIEQNVEMAGDRFVLPADVQALLDRESPAAAVAR